MRSGKRCRRLQAMNSLCTERRDDSDENKNGTFA